MQIVCIVRECGAEARHYIRSSKLPGVTFNTCTYHASGVYVKVCDKYKGKVCLGTSFRISYPEHYQLTGSQQGRHELAG